jgi:rubrerythrin
MSNKRTLRERSHGQKKQHKTIKSALKHIQTLYEKDPEGFRPMGYYICRYCGFLHVGHQPAKNRPWLRKD